MLAEVGRVGVAPAVFLMYLIKSQVLKCRPRLTIPIKKRQARANTGLLHIIVYNQSKNLLPFQPVLK